MTEPAAPPRPIRKRRWRRRLAWTGAVLLVLLAASEWFCRAYLGLGDPPLAMSHPTIEYLFVPDRTYHRFGNRIVYNHYAQRSDPVTPTRTDPRELRVLCVGDSVLNGGVLTDHSQLATTLLQTRLSEALGRPVRVLNASAGSWGPPNELAYVETFGWFDADALVLIVSSHDAWDVPTFQPAVGVDPSLPDHTPWLATGELLTRYALPRVEQWLGVETPTPPPPTQADGDAATAAFGELIRRARTRGMPVVVLQNPEASELAPATDPAAQHLRQGHDWLKRVAEADDAQVVQLADAYRQALLMNRQPYRDYIHPSADGQQAIAEALFTPLRDALKLIAATRPASGPAK